MEKMDYELLMVSGIKECISVNGYDILTLSFILEQYITHNEYLYNQFRNWGLKILRELLRVAMTDQMEREIIYLINNLKKPYNKVIKMSVKCPKCNGNDVFLHEADSLYECECGNLWKRVIVMYDEKRDFDCSKPFLKCRGGCGLWANITETQKRFRENFGYYICINCGKVINEITSSQFRNKDGICINYECDECNRHCMEDCESCIETI